VTPVATRENALPATPTSITLTQVSVVAGDRETIAPSQLTAQIRLAAEGGVGRVVALTGPSGSGKSTTALVLLGLLTPDAGTVTLGTESGLRQTLAEYGLENWWSQLIWVPQRPALEGRARELSIGQRQWLALAEVATAPPEKRVLMLDEPTAHLDAVSEAQVLNILKQWRDSGRTAIVIAHRPAVIDLADQVIEVHAQGGV